MFYNFPGAPGNTGYQAQANPNPLTDPRFKIPGGAPWGNRPLLPNEKETFDKPFTPLLSPGQNVPMAQGFARDIGNVAGMNNVQIAGGFNLLNPMTWGQGQEAVNKSNKGIQQGPRNDPSRPVNTILNRNAEEARQLQELKRQGLL